MPRIVQEIGREGPAMFLQMPTGRLNRPVGQLHMRLRGGAATLFQIAGQACGCHIFPGRAAVLATRNDMVKGEIVG